MYGGMALTSAGTAAVHALAYPIGARYGIPHGIANSMLLVPVLEFSLDSCSERLSTVADVMGIESSSMGNVEKAEWVLGRLKALICDLRIPVSLKPFGCEESHLDDLSAAASEVKRLLDNNPKAMSLRDIKNIYRRLLG
jgi:alcohol dehydrogenase class IV